MMRYKRKKKHQIRELKRRKIYNKERELYIIINVSVIPLAINIGLKVTLSNLDGPRDGQIDKQQQTKMDTKIER